MKSQNIITMPIYSSTVNGVTDPSFPELLATINGLTFCLGTCLALMGMAEFTGSYSVGGKHTVRVEITDVYNRMLDITGINPAEFCLSGFILMNNIVFPPPIYGSWCFRKMKGQDFLSSTNPKILRLPREKYINTVVPPNGNLLLMDLFGQGTLDFMTLTVDHEMRLETLDGGAQGIGAPTWIRQISIPSWMKNKQCLTDSFPVMTEDNEIYIAVISKKLHFGNRLIIKLNNLDNEPHNLLEVYMEGSLRLM